MEPIEVELPPNATPIREVRLVQYVDEDGDMGMGIGVEGEGGFDLVATLGMLALASNLLLTDREN